MKKVTLLVLIASGILFTDCKKKEKTPEPEPTPAPAPAPPTHVNKMTAKLNGSDWSMAKDQYSEASILSSFGTSRTFGGLNSFTSPQTEISISFECVTGTHTLTEFGPYKAKYYANGTTYTSKTGTVNITMIDTSKVKSQWIDKFKCTFSFGTNTVSGQSFQVTEGVVDFEKK